MIVRCDQWVIYSIGRNGSNLVMDRFRIHAFELHHINYAGERDPYVRRPNVPHPSDADYRLIWNHIDDIRDPCELSIQNPLGKGKIPRRLVVHNHSNKFIPAVPKKWGATLVRRRDLFEQVWSRRIAKAYGNFFYYKDINYVMDDVDRMNIAEIVMNYDMEEFKATALHIRRWEEVVIELLSQYHQSDVVWYEDIIDKNYLDNRYTFTDVKTRYTPNDSPGSIPTPWSKRDLIPNYNEWKEEFERHVPDEHRL